MCKASLQVVESPFLKKIKKVVDKKTGYQYNTYCSIEKHKNMHEWLSGGVSPCQGEGRGFESRLVLFLLV